MIYPANSPHAELAKSWRKYSRYLNDYRDFLTELRYNGFETNSKAAPMPATTAGYVDDTEVSNALDPKPSYYAKNVFTLPAVFEELPAEAMLEPVALPNFPNIKLTPQITLARSEYPSGYDQIHIDREIKQWHAIIAERQALTRSLLDKKMSCEALFASVKLELDSVELGLSNGDPRLIEKLVEIVNRRYKLPEFFRRAFQSHYDQNSNILLIEFEFPDYSSESIFVEYDAGLVGRTGNSFFEYAKCAKPAAKKKLVRTILYSLIVRIAYLAARYVPRFTVKSVVVNVKQQWFDPATGQQRSGIIATVQAPTEYLCSLDLGKLNPEACVRHLKGIVTPNLDSINPVRPIFVLNKTDDRLIAGKNVSEKLEDEANLAAMPWEDFEHLVAQLFEWEFAKSGVEVRVTRASRDRGVDAILFDPDPLRGGKYVLQAKRYTRTVDVSAVRDLYGTVMNEGANRGILIATSSYGPDSYEFAKDKPISLVDGPNLLLMLQKHGKKFKIDLEEARRLNVED